MPLDTLLSATIELMVIGMGSVFTILGLMIVCMNLLGRFAPKEKSYSKHKDDKPVIAAIQTAVHQYRNQTAQRSTA